MAGRKTFTAGEVLQAADVNDFLMDQSVMVFAGTAARGSAIPSPTEGMVTYREDDDTVEVFDGSAFVPVGSDPGLVEVKSAIFTGTQTGSVAGGGNLSVTDLSITHEVANASNKLIISAFLGAAAHSDTNGQVGLAINDGSGLISVGVAAGSRTSVTSGGGRYPDSTVFVTSPSITFVHTPGAGSKTYSVRAISMTNTTQTLYINRSQDDVDQAQRPRAVSALVIQEVSV